MIGVLLCMQYAFVKGGWHLIKAYGAARHISLTSMLEYEGIGPLPPARPPHPDG